MMRETQKGKPEHPILVMITGDAGVGKTTVSKELFQRIDGCAWLDADWCWMIKPWKNKTVEQKDYTVQTFLRILKGYLENDSISVVIFSWLMRTPWMFELITEPLKDYNLKVVKVALVCDKEKHIERKIKDNRRQEQIYQGSSQDFYNLGAYIVDTTDKNPQEIAEVIKKEMSL